MKRIILGMAKAMVLSCAVSMILLVLTAFVLLKVGFSESNAKIISGIIYFLSSFIGGFVLGKVMESRKFMWGIGCGLTYFVILLALSAIVEVGGSVVGMGLVTALAISVVGGMIGGMAG